MLLEDALDFADANHTELPAQRSTVLDTPDALDPLSLQVIAISRLDNLRSANPSTRAAWIVTRLFGIEPRAPLADIKLETLRRYCIFLRQGDNRALDLYVALEEVGYSATQREAIGALIAEDHAR